MSTIAGVNKKPKILTVLGGGSVWTPYLLLRLAEIPEAEFLRIRLHGPTLAHLQEVRDFTRIAVGERLDVAVRTGLDEAVAGAEIILNQARIGGWKARLDDETLPVKLGVVGDESLGLGGLRAAIRTWPFIAQTARTISRLAPKALILNLTNPSDLMTRAWRQSGCKQAVSLCEYPQRFFQEIAALAADPDLACQSGFLGMIHVGWLIPPTGVRLHEVLTKRPHLASWFQKWKALPTDWRIHLDNASSLLAGQRKNPGGRARQLMKLVKLLRKAFRAGDVELYRALLMQRPLEWYSISVIPMIRALLGGRPTRLIVGLPNAGRLQGLDSEVLLENWAAVDGYGIRPEPLPSNPECEHDVVAFGKCRALAFEAMRAPDRCRLASYLRADDFTRQASLQPDWLEKQGKRMRFQ